MPNAHFLSAYLRQSGYTNELKDKPIQDRDITKANEELKKDKNAFFLNGLLSFSTCINSLKKENYSWAFVQSYYSIFYLLESLIAANGHGIYYAGKNGSTAYRIELSRGSYFMKASGSPSSHKVVFNAFKDLYPNDIMLSNNIREKCPLDWFIESRELINYKQTPYPDPIPPINIFKYSDSIRGWLHTYNNDETYSYVFAEAHAYIAYPFKLIDRILRQNISRSEINPFITPNVLQLLRKNLSDSKGPLTLLTDSLQQIANEQG
jgi:hypothetical protein